MLISLANLHVIRNPFYLRFETSFRFAFLILIFADLGRASDSDATNPPESLEFTTIEDDHRYARSCPDSFLLVLLLALACGRFPNPCRTRGLVWRRGSESDKFHRFIANRIEGFIEDSNTIWLNLPLLGLLLAYTFTDTFTDSSAQLILETARISDLNSWQQSSYHSALIPFFNKKSLYFL